MTKKRKPEWFRMRIEPGSIVPADHYTRLRLREKGYARGDEVLVAIKKDRSNGFFRLTHAFADVLRQNIDAFAHKPSAHEVLKELQRRTGICCEQYEIDLPHDLGKLVVNEAQSLNFEDMEEGDFRELFAGMCQYVRKNYWPDVTDEEMKAMAEEMMVREPA